MPWSTKVSGDWKTVDEIYVKVGGAWKQVEQARIKVTGSWRVSHSSELVASLTTAIASAFSPAATGTIVTNDVTAFVSGGGSGFYTYLWTRTSADNGIVIYGDTLANTAWSYTRSTAGAYTVTETWKCTITDTVSLETADTPDVTVQIDFTSP